MYNVYIYIYRERERGSCGIAASDNGERGRATGLLRCPSNCLTTVN